MAEAKTPVPDKYRISDISLRGSDNMVTCSMQIDDGRTSITCTAPSTSVQMTGGSINTALRNAAIGEFKRGIAALENENALEAERVKKAGESA